MARDFGKICPFANGCDHFLSKFDGLFNGTGRSRHKNDLAQLQLWFAGIDPNPLQLVIDLGVHLLKAAGEFGADIVRPGQIAQIFYLHRDWINAEITDHAASTFCFSTKILIDQVTHLRQKQRAKIRYCVFGCIGLQHIIDQQLQRIIGQPFAIGVGNRNVGCIL